MKINPKESVLYRTGQAWKFWVQACGSLFCVLIVISAVWSGGVTPSFHNILFVLSGAFVGLFSFAFASFFIRCPICGDRWYWSAIAKKHDTGGIEWLLCLKECPACEGNGNTNDQAE